MALPYWIEAALPGLLPCLWLAGGLGLPWAFALTARRDWRCYPLIGALALALGPAWMAAWMLALGVLGAQLEQRLMTPGWIVAGSVIISLTGMALAWRRRAEKASSPSQALRLALDEKLIITLIVVAVALRWLHTAYFPFTAYDALWVFGYQGRLFALEGMIPQAIDYYPPFLSLQFAYVQTMIGALNDHAARMILPMMHIGSILAAYLLGGRLLSRRIGIFTAALWSLHPYVAQWSWRGDLEITLTFSFTLAAVFLLRAWRERDDHKRRHDALLAGVMLGIALFTKPTAGAFIWGVMLLLAFEILRAGLRPELWLPRARVAFWTGLACLPLGGVWYLRNLLLGHELITMPKALWLGRALRSGDYLAPLILIALLAALMLLLRQKLKTGERTLTLAGMALLAVGALASNASLFPARVDPPASYIRLEEWLLMLLGLALMALGLRRILLGPRCESARKSLDIGLWALLLALPYFVTLFFSYSYHYRLGFAIVPMLCLPSAIALAHIFERERMKRWRNWLRRACISLLLILCLPGVVAVLTDVHWSSIWLLREDLPSDFEKVQHFNPSLMQVVLGLNDYLRQPGAEAIVLAPGEERLPFFFPRMQIHAAPLTTLDELEALGATHIIYGSKAREAYEEAGIEPARTQLVAALGRYDLFDKTRSHYDAVFDYELYEVSANLGATRLPAGLAAADRPEVVFGGVLQLYADALFPRMNYAETPMTYEPSWRALAQLTEDYEFVLEVKHDVFEDSHTWRLLTAPQRHGAYHTSLWTPGEIVNDRHILTLPPEAKLDDPGFTFWLGVWDPSASAYLPASVDGQPVGDFYRLPGVYQFEH